MRRCIVTLQSGTKPTSSSGHKAAAAAAADDDDDNDGDDFSDIGDDYDTTGWQKDEGSRNAEPKPVALTPTGGKAHNDSGSAVTSKRRSARAAKAKSTTTATVRFNIL